MSSGTCQARSNIIPLFHCRLKVANSTTTAGTNDRPRQGPWRAGIDHVGVGPLLTAAASCPHTEYAVQNCGQWPGRSAVKSHTSRKPGDECRYGDLFPGKAGCQGGCLPRRILSVLHTWHTYQLVFRHLQAPKPHWPSSLLSRGFREKDHQPTLLPAGTQLFCVAASGAEAYSVRT